jgi:DNA-binding LacI/PurR family transcriptional regulator
VAISDLPAFSLVDPAITAIGVDYEALGRRAAMRLVARLTGTAGLPRIERLAPVITSRASVAAPRPE